MVRDDHSSDFGFRRILGLVLLVFAAFLPAQAAPTVDTNVLWVADDGQLLKLATTEARISLQIPDARAVQALAVDEQRRVVWTAQPGRLVAYDFSGKSLHTVMTPVPDRRGPGETGQAEDSDHPAARLPVDNRSGDVWLALGDAVYRLSAEGTTQSPWRAGSKRRMLSPMRRLRGDSAAAARRLPRTDR